MKSPQERGAQGDKLREIRHEQAKQKRDQRHDYRNFILRCVVTFFCGAIVGAFGKALGFGGFLYGVFLFALGFCFAKLFN